MENLSFLNYSLELLLAETVFCYSLPRRKYFVLRLIPGMAFALGVSYFLMKNYRDSAPWIVFIAVLGTILSTFLCMALTYRANYAALLSSCVAGVAVQHIAYHLYLLLVLFAGEIFPASSLNELFVSCLCCLAAFLTLGRRLAVSRQMDDEDPRIVGIAVVIVLICTGLMRFFRMSYSLNTIVNITVSLYAITCCSLALFILFALQHMVRMKNEYAQLEHIQKQEKEQYKISQENEEQLKLKTHDLKHKLLSLKTRLPQDEIDSMMALVNEYDGFYKTGLSVLDTVLNEKKRRCTARGIAMTVMGDGKCLSFMKTMDVYSLFGNILDNAIEATEKLSLPEKKTISLVISRKGNLIHINTSNFIEEPVMLMPDGLPPTTKTSDPGWHGYGLKNVRAIVSRYGGHINITLENEVFGLNLFLSPEDDVPA